MATKKYLSLERLREYDALIKAEIAAKDAETLASANSEAASLVEQLDRTLSEKTTDLEGQINDLSTYVGTFTASEGVDTVVKYIDAKTANIASNETVTALNDKVTTLIGDDANKSVRTIANEELAKQLIAEGADESLNSLQEIAAWIQSHPDDAAAMNKAIEDLETLVGTIPDGVTATTIVGYIQEAVAAEKARAEAEEAYLTENTSNIWSYMGIIPEGKGFSICEYIASEVDSAKDTHTVLTDDINTLKDVVKFETSITDSDISNWNTAEQNAKDYTDGLVAEFVECSTEEINALFTTA